MCSSDLTWGNAIESRELAWCDALFMGPPALAAVAKATGDARYLDLANRLWWKTTAFLYDSEERLYFRDSRFFTQREIGPDVPNFADGVKAAIREDPDCLLVGEMRDLETIRLALTAAETGLLVFATVHTNSAAKAVDRIIDAFPAAEQEQVRVERNRGLDTGRWRNPLADLWQLLA